LVAVALIAAAIADPLVESVSNSGVFGGAYRDDDHSGVLPVLLLGAMLVLSIVALRCREVWRRASRASRPWMAELARELAARAASRDVPIVLALQLAALFLLESGEQLFSGSKLLGGTAWLGGPIAFSLAVHALIGIACTCAFGALVRAVIIAFASLVCEALAWSWVAACRNDGRVLRARSRELTLPALAPFVNDIGGRAPPLPSSI
jgi:hypothetical protein